MDLRPGAGVHAAQAGAGQTVYVARISISRYPPLWHADRVEPHPSGGLDVDHQHVSAVQQGA